MGGMVKAQKLEDARMLVVRQIYKRPRCPVKLAEGLEPAESEPF
jgi:hypothetical protein